MAPLFGPSSTDLAHLRSTVRQLGTTSVPGLAAALSWRERKTEKLLAVELARPLSPIVYDPSRRTVRWAVTAAPVPAPSTRPPAPSPPPRGPVPSAPPPTFTATGLRTVCPRCHVPLQSTGSATLVVCPQCGRLSSARSAAFATDAPKPSAPAAPTAGPAHDVGASISDRRSQELFAAWVTNQPIPCPKCRTPLRHRGLNVYACVACGQQVRFPSVAPGPAASAAPPAPPAPMPAQ